MDGHRVFTPVVSALFAWLALVVTGRFLLRLHWDHVERLDLSDDTVGTLLASIEFDF